MSVFCVGVAVISRRTLVGLTEEIFEQSLKGSERLSLGDKGRTIQVEG